MKKISSFLSEDYNIFSRPALPLLFRYSIAQRKNLLLLTNSLCDLQSLLAKGIVVADEISSAKRLNTGKFRTSYGQRENGVCWSSVKHQFGLLLNHLIVLGGLIRLCISMLPGDMASPLTGFCRHQIA